MASLNFNAGIRAIVTGAIDLDTDSFKMLLVSSVLGETEKDGFAFRNAIVNEIAGTGYTAGGAACVLAVAAQDNANNDIEITGAAVVWPGATITALGAVIYKSRGGASSADELLCFIDFLGTVNSTGAAFTVTPSGSLKFQS